MRTKWTKAAMPGPRNLNQNQAILQLLARNQIPQPKSSGSRPSDYPWETKITPPPPRKREANVDPRDEEALQRIFRALRQEAFRRSGESKKEDDEKNAKAREEAAAKQAAAAEAQFKADAATIADAVQRALDTAQLQSVKTATELATLRAQGHLLRSASASRREAEGARRSMASGENVQNRSVLRRTWSRIRRGRGTPKETKWMHEEQKPGNQESLFPGPPRIPAANTFSLTIRPLLHCAQRPRLYYSSG